MMHIKVVNDLDALMAILVIFLQRKLIKKLIYKKCQLFLPIKTCGIELFLILVANTERRSSPFSSRSSSTDVYSTLIVSKISLI